MLTTSKWTEGRLPAITQLLEICQTEEEFLLITDVLSRMTYVSGDLLEICLGEIAKQILEVWQLSASNTSIAFKDIEGKTDSSAALQQMIKPHFSGYDGWKSSRNFRPELKTIIKDPSFNNIVIIDDFSGTGNSLEKILIWIHERCAEFARPNIDVYICFISVMDSTLNFKYTHRFKEMFYCLNSSKVITDYYGSSAPSKISIMLDIEARYDKIAKGYSLGYKASEAAFAVQNLNIPNNALPILWHKSRHSKINPIFKRLPK